MIEEEKRQRKPRSFQYREAWELVRGVAADVGNELEGD